MTRGEAIKVLNGMLYLNYRNFWDEECDEAIEMAIEALQDRPKGEWIKYESPMDYDDGKDAWDCSLCGAMVGKRMNYCPNCGADMRGEKHEFSK